MLRRLFRAQGAPPPHPGKPRALDGLSAVAILESRISDIAGLGASHPAALAARVWEARRGQTPLNVFGAPIRSVLADGPRGALSAALGASLGGQRATAFLSGPDLNQCRDLVAQAAGRRAPLVVHAALRAIAGHAQALGSGHEAYHALADLPAALFFARHVQEAVDLTLVARRVAELAMLPVVVAMDAEQTALALQDVAMPEDELVRSYLGAPAELLPPATRAQRMLFGDVRRRVPRLFDLERPMLLGPLQGPEAWAIGAASARVLLDADLGRLAQESVDVFAGLSGRRCDGVWTHRTEDASIVFIAQGSMVEHAAAAAEYLREHERLRIGVLGISRLNPLDGGAIARALRGVQVACTLERLELSVHRDGPLAQTVRGVLDRALENGRSAKALHPDLPALAGHEIPRVVTCAAGAGGSPVRIADLATLAGHLTSASGASYVLGIDFARRSSTFPKHQALLDAMRREFNLPKDLGIVASDASPAQRAKGPSALLVARAAGSGEESLAGEIGLLAHALVGGHVRSRPAVSWHRHDASCIDRIMLSPGAFFDPGEGSPAAVAVFVKSPNPVEIEPLLAEDAELVAPVALAETLRPFMRASRKLRLVPDDVSGSPDLEREALLGAALRAILERTTGSAPASIKAKTRREDLLPALEGPAREKRLAAFLAGYESLAATRPMGVAPSKALDDEAMPPRELLQMAREAGGLASPTRFWSHTGVHYAAGTTCELVPEPAAAFGAVPALTSTMRRVGGAGGVLPVFDPATCDGDPVLWMSCPDGSAAPLAITPRDLINAGIELASRAGRQADALRPIVPQLAKRIAKSASEPSRPDTAGGLLRAAFEDVVSKLDAPADRKASLRAACEVVEAQVGDLPVAITDVFFRDPERAAPGTGALLSVVVNPDACKCPQLLLARGAGHGFAAVSRTAETEGRARALWNLWRDLPDTAGEILERSRKDPKLGPLAALMLSRHCLHAMAPGDGSEAGSGAKLALRQVLAIAEFHHQPRAQKLLAEVSRLQAKIADRIRGLLAAALPTSDLDALAEGLQVLGRGEVELAALSTKIETAVGGGHVDGDALAGLVDIARELADLQWKVCSGPMGLGRARLGLTVASGAVAEWAAAFPYNPFVSPTVIDACGEAAPLARGVLEACLHEVASGFRTIRVARTVLERPAEAPHAAARLAGLTYAELTESERELVPPMLLVGDGQSLGSRGLSQLVWLLDSDLPVKAVILSDAGGRADGAMSLDSQGSYPPAQRYDTALLATLARRAVVAQASIAYPDHFFESIERAVAVAGPAVIQIHTPSPERHGFPVAALFEQASLAVRSRAWPIFSFDPGRRGVFGTCLDISHNPDPASAWTSDTTGTCITPLHWAVTERRFEEEFASLEPGAPAPTQPAVYLDPACTGREKLTPVLEVEVRGERTRLRVGADLAADALDRTRLWRTLQELSGAVTPFTEQVRAEVEASVARSHDDALARLRAEHERQLAALRASYDTEATDRVTSRLLSLAGYGDGAGR